MQTRLGIAHGSNRVLYHLIIPGQSPGIGRSYLAIVEEKVKPDLT